MIMVTGLVENGRDKCGPYFPLTDTGAQSVVKFGDFTIANDSITNYGPYMLSKFSVSHAKETRKINHWWFTAWPDHGVPTAADGSFDVDSLLDMLQHIHEGHAEEETQMSQLVHCSAGVGRTGVTIALQNAIQELADSQFTDPLATIHCIRQDRCFLVQHVEQYYYLHRAIVRYCERIGRAIQIQYVARFSCM
jgi:receptor-type tyrosine-protein phosphatase O